LGRAVAPLVEGAARGNAPKVLEAARRQPTISKRPANPSLELSGVGNDRHGDGVGRSARPAQLKGAPGSGVRPARTAAKRIGPRLLGYRVGREIPRGSRGMTVTTSPGTIFSTSWRQRPAALVSGIFFLFEHHPGPRAVVVGALASGGEARSGHPPCTRRRSARQSRQHIRAFLRHGCAHAVADRGRGSPPRSSLFF